MFFGDLECKKVVRVTNFYSTETGGTLRANPTNPIKLSFFVDAIFFHFKLVHFKVNAFFPNVTKTPA